MANAYTYSNVAVQTTLSGNISAGATSVPVGAVTGFPVQYPYVLAFDYGATAEELVVVTAAAGTTLTVTRAFGGTSGQSHSIGAVVRHVYNAQDATDFRTHEASTGAVHGLTGSIVGTSDTQTLSNKTLTSPTINAGALSGTLTGTPTFNGAVVFSGAPNISAGGALAGTFTGSPTLSGNVNHTGLIRSTQTLTTDVSYAAILTGDGFDRFRNYGSGLLEWGPGNAARDTNLYRSGANVLSTDDSINVALNAQIGGNLTVSGIGAELHARKTADTNVANTTVTQDPHLVVAVPANSTWEMVGCLFYTSAVITGDINYQFTGPAGSAGFHTTVGPSTVVNTDPPNEAVGASQSGNRTIATAIGSGRSYGVPVASSVFGLEVKGMFEIAGTAGNISVDWAEQTANATATTLKIYSWFRLTRVA